jgi:hypothetical protein
MRNAVLSVLVVVLLAANAGVARAHDWWYWHWSGSGMRVYIGNYTAQAEAARSDWAAHTHLALKRGPPQSEIVVFGDDWGPTQWQGLATVEEFGAAWPWQCGGAAWCRILRARARYNAFYKPTDEPENAYVQGIFCQELGHTWGLAHSDSDDCMGKGTYPGSKHRNTSGPHSWADVNGRY